MPTRPRLVPIWLAAAAAITPTFAADSPEVCLDARDPLGVSLDATGVTEAFGPAAELAEARVDRSGENQSLGIGVACPAGATLEDVGECFDGFDEELDPNGGCNSVPAQFGSISFGETICGTSGTFTADDGADTRDTDWYRFSVAGPETVTVHFQGDFRALIGIVDGLSDCTNPDFLDFAQPDPGETASLSVVLPQAGEYAIFVATARFTGVPCGTGYVVSLECPVGATVEDADDCFNGYNPDSDPNGGCNAFPVQFGSIAFGETICGTSGTFLRETGGSTRDTDWYRFSVAGPETVTVDFRGDFDALIGIVDGVSDCSGPSFLGFAQPPAREEASVSVDLPGAGEYAVFVSTNLFTGVPCGSGYIVSLTLLESCNAADLAEPFGVLDLSDINTFVAGFLRGETVADLNGDDVFDLGDINLFTTAFVAGCP